MVKKSALDVPETKKSVVQMLAMGKSQAAVARYSNMSESQISRFANRDDIKRMISEESYRLMDCLPDAVQNLTDLVKGMRNLGANDHKNRDLSYRASLKVLETAGVTPVAGQVSQVTTILQQNNVDLSPAVEKLLMLHFGMNEQTNSVPENET